MVFRSFYAAYNCYYLFLDFIIPTQNTTEEPQLSNDKKVLNLFLISPPPVDGPLEPLSSVCASVRHKLSGKRFIQFL